MSVLQIKIFENNFKTSINIKMNHGLEKIKSIYELSNIIGSIDEHRKLLCFRESLIISKFINEDSDEHPIPVGGMCLDVQPALNGKFVIYTSTKFNVDSAVGGSKISTWVDPYFYTIEEKRIEFINQKDEDPCDEREIPNKQSLYIGYDGDFLHVAHTMENFKCKKKYPVDSVNNLISEGANFIFMRYLARSLFEGAIEMTSLYINGDLCRNIYECLPVAPSTVNDIKTLTVKINRTIIEQCGITHHCSTVLTVDGHIVKQEWKGCNYTIQLNPLQNPIAYALCEEACGCQGAQNLVHYWQNDIELMSKYLDQRKLYEYKAKDYIENTPELSDMLADYVKALLQHKPEEVLDFTSSYFMRYGS